MSLADAIQRFLDAKRGTLRAATVTKYEGKLEHWQRDHTPAGINLCDVQPKKEKKAARVPVRR